MGLSVMGLSAGAESFIILVPSQSGLRFPQIVVNVIAP